MEDIIISMLTKLGLGKEGVINNADNFADTLNEFIDNKHDFKCVKLSNDTIKYVSNKGVNITYKINPERKTIIDLKVE